MPNVEEVTDVFEHLQLQPFRPPSESMSAQIVPGFAETQLSWAKLSALNFVSMRCVIDAMTNVRKRLVSDLNPSVLAAIGAAIEQIRVPGESLFSATRRFPEGIHVAWSPVHPMIQSICLLQKLCVSRLPDQPLTCARLLAVVENVENCIFALDIKDHCVYDREKFERTIARWKFDWRQLSYYYEVFGDATPRFN